MAFEYQGVATLGVNLNRQKYGPLDVSSVLLKKAHLDWYILGQKENAPDGWSGGTPYPYPGQIIVTLDDNTAYQLYEKEGVLTYRAMLDLSNFYSKKEIDGMLANISVDMSDYYNKEEIDSLIESIEGTSGSNAMIAMTEEDILLAIGVTVNS